MLVKAVIKAELVAGLLKASQSKADVGIDEFTDMLSTAIINAIQSADLLIPSGAINTVGSATAQANAAPVIVTNGLS